MSNEDSTTNSAPLRLPISASETADRTTELYDELERELNFLKYVKTMWEKKLEKLEKTHVYLEKMNNIPEHELMDTNPLFSYNNDFNNNFDTSVNVGGDDNSNMEHQKDHKLEEQCSQQQTQIEKNKLYDENYEVEEEEDYDETEMEEDYDEAEEEEEDDETARKALAYMWEEFGDKL